MIILKLGGDSVNVDISIIRKCKKKDKNAFMELFKGYEKYLYKLCYSYVQNEQDALDIMQEIYIKIFRNIVKFNEKMPFHPWFRRVAVNTCINFKRAIKYNTVSINEDKENSHSLEEQLSSGNDVEKYIEQQDLSNIIKTQLTLLSPKHRMVILLRYFEDLSYEEIATVLDMPIGTVKTNLFRARNLLKNKLSDIMVEGKENQYEL